jgi:hypothetical protein
VAYANKYPGLCKNCGLEVPAGAGVLAGKDASTGRWLVAHEDNAACIEAANTSTPLTAVATATTATAGFPPTAEQQKILDAFKTEKSLVIQAGAGTGKTSTLKLLAANTTRKGRYIVFNKANAVEVNRSLPDNVQASTAHSLAYQAIVTGSPFADRLKNSRRQPARQVALRIGITTPFEAGDRILPIDKLASIALSAVTLFCQSADEKPAEKHVPYVEGLDEPGPRGARRYDNNRLLARFLVPYVRKAWADISNPKGALQFKHEHYLKLFHLSHAKIDGDFIFFDEAQDANPVLLAIVNEQTHLQRVFVGDSNQQIYEFTGAVNALAKLEEQGGYEVLYLTQSFRFGTAVADAANHYLRKLESPLVLKGFDKIDSVVEAFTDEPDAILTRTNACAVDCILAAQERGVKAHLVGEGKEVLAFAKAARELQFTGTTEHADLACFRTWDEVKDYVKNEEQGAELKLNVDLIEKYSIETIIQALGNQPKEQDAELVISTAHKSKGREWNRVRIAGDFIPKPPANGDKPAPPSPSELRLRYVAVTRAKLQLDNSALVEAEGGTDAPSDN